MCQFIAKAWRNIAKFTGLSRFIEFIITRVAFCLAHPLAFFSRSIRRTISLFLELLLVIILVIFVLNLVFNAPVNVAFRALDPSSEACKASPGGWDILARETIGNNEWLAVDQGSTGQSKNEWEMRLHCSIQTHAVPGYQPTHVDGTPVGDKRTLVYDLAFLEFQEDGNPYVLCTQDEYERNRCDGATVDPSGAGQAPRRGQLEALIQRLGKSEKNFVIVFVHGWRHNSQIGDENVADLRVYTAYAARFIADRCEWGDTRFCGMKATGVYVGWRGSRTDENRLQRVLAPLVRFACGGSTALVPPAAGKSSCLAQSLAEWVGTAIATITLFDRKPVSEAIGPAVYAALQTIELNIGLQHAIREGDLAPCEHDKLKDCIATTDQDRRYQARMIVFGHSLGGNMLATALQDEMVKMVERHRPRREVPDSDLPGTAFHTEPADFLPAPIGNLVVLINPASEAAKWTEIQRVVWRQTEMSYADKGHSADYAAGNWYFRPEQRPVMISVTAARDWPPGGLRPIDCIKFQDRIAQAETTGADTKDLEKALREEWGRRTRSVDYDGRPMIFFLHFDSTFGQWLHQCSVMLSGNRQVKPGAPVLPTHRTEHGSALSTMQPRCSESFLS
jgi:hypothetical protein